MEALPSEIELPETLPVMVLPDCTLFPCCLLPLYIFEPRYRSMLAHALENDRMFCVGTARSGTSGEHDDTIHDVSTAGLIRACVSQPDGTSNLILQGVRRIRLSAWEQRSPFRVARIEDYGDLNSEAADEFSSEASEVNPGRSEHEIAEELLNVTIENGSISDALTSHLRELRDPAAIGDVVAYNLITDPDLKQEILEIPRLRTRLRLLLAYCSAQIGKQDS